MAVAILKQSNFTPPTLDEINVAMACLREEREQIEALAIALADRMADAEKNDGGSSTELLLAQMLNERISHQGTLKTVEQLLKARAA